MGAQRRGAQARARPCSQHTGGRGLCPGGMVLGTRGQDSLMSCLSQPSGSVLQERRTPPGSWHHPTLQARSPPAPPTSPGSPSFCWHSCHRALTARGAAHHCTVQAGLPRAAVSRQEYQEMRVPRPNGNFAGLDCAEGQCAPPGAQLTSSILNMALHTRPTSDTLGNPGVTPASSPGGGQ